VERQYNLKRRDNLADVTIDGRIKWNKVTEGGCLTTLALRPVMCVVHSHCSYHINNPAPWISCRRLLYGTWLWLLGFNTWPPGDGTWVPQRT